MTLRLGQQYRLVLPDVWAESAPEWQQAVVTLVRINKYFCLDPRPRAVCDCEGCYVGDFTAWVTASDLTSGFAFAGNIFRAKPAWLQELPTKTLCDCPLKLVLSHGCQNQNHS